MRRYLILIACAGLFTAWLGPVHFLPWVSWHNEAPVFLSVLLMATLALVQASRLPVGDLHVGVSAAGLVMCSMALAVVVQAATGLIAFWGDAWAIVVYLVLCFVAMQLGSAGAQGPRGKQGAAEPIAWILFVGAAASAMVALAQVLDVWENLFWIARMPDLRRPGANIGQPNQLATLMLMGVASVIYLRELSLLGRFSSHLALALLSVCLVITESRTGLLGLCALMAWTQWGRGSAKLRIHPSTIVTLLGGVALLFLAWPPFFSLIQGAGAPGMVNTNAGTRLVVWPQLLEAISERPWLGWGLRSTSVALSAVTHAHPISEPFTYAHNIVLDLALGFGLPIALVVIGGGLVWLCRRVLRIDDVHSWYCAAAVVPVALHAMLEFPHAYAYFLAPVLFLLGVLEAGSARIRFRTRRWVAASALAATGALGVWTVVEYVQIEEDFRVARFESLRIGTTPIEYERPKVYVLTQLGALLEGARVSPHPGMTDERIELTRQVAGRFPWPATQNRYALALALNGQPELALKELRVIRAMHGEKTYEEIKANWSWLAQDRYAVLSGLPLP